MAKIDFENTPTELLEVLRKSHVGIARHNPLSQTKLQKRGRIQFLPLFFGWLKTSVRLISTLLGFCLVFLFYRLSGIGAASFAGSLGVLEEPVPLVLQVPAAVVVAALVLPSYRTRQMLA